MRGKKAKAIRKAVYADDSIRIKEYREGHEPQLMIATGEKNPLTGNIFFKSNPTVFCSGLRRKYQDLKAFIQTIGKKPTIEEALSMM